MKRPAGVLLWACLLTGLLASEAACPFAHLFAANDAQLAAGSASEGGRKLLQVQPPPKQPPPKTPPKQPPGGGPLPPTNPPQPAAPCDIPALVAAGPYTPAGPSSQGAVDQRVKDVAWAVITGGSAAAGPGAPPAPGVGQPGSPNQAAPLGALLRLAFHDAGTFDR